MDVKKKGITVLYEAKSPAIDIVVVHGFTGDPITTWTLKNAKQSVASDEGTTVEPSESDDCAPKPSTKIHKRTFDSFTHKISDYEKRSSKFARLFTGRGREIQEHRSTPTATPRRDVFWPRDLLPSTVPNARILTYGYDTKIRHTFIGPVSKNNVVDHGWDLLCALEEVRRDDPSRPLLFIAHSLGGLIAKIALIKSRDNRHLQQHLHYVVASTVGVFFFGTPHRGADPLGPGIRQILTALAKGFGFRLNDSIVGTLLPSGDYLREIRDSFMGLAKLRELIIYSFQEEYGVSGLGGNKVVDDESSRLDEPTIEIPRHISNNHMDMVRFTGPDDNEYRKVESALFLVVQKLTSTRQATENIGPATGFTTGRGSDSARDVDTPVPPEKLQARKELMDLLYFDEIDVRLMSLKSCHKETCQWLLEKDDYHQWLSPARIDEHHGFLWIKGKPGAGKSTLMKFLDNNARNTATASRKIVVSSFFFNARGEELERSTLGLYRSLLWQLLEKVEDLQAVLDSLESNAQRFIERSGWQIEILKQTLANAIEHFRGDRELRLFIDALDECSDDDVADMISYFEDLGERAAEHKVSLRICFSSRYYPTIIIKKGIEMKLDEEEDHSRDIVRYIKSQLKLGRSKKAEELTYQILEKSAGIFLWVALVIPMLNKACSSGKVDRFQKCLKDIPSGLHELFEMIVTRDEEDLDEFRLCIQWILFATRPLKIEEYFFALREADNETIMSSWQSGEISQDDLCQFVLSSSKGFAEVTKTRSNKKSPTIQFIHESVRDFFLSRNSDGIRRLWPRIDDTTFASSSHNTLKARCCEEIVRRGQDCIPSLVPLNEALPKVYSRDADPLRQLVSNKLPFLEYATSNLLAHANAAAVDLPQDYFLENYPLDAWVNFYNVFAKRGTPRYTGLASLIPILDDCQRIRFRFMQVLLAGGLDPCTQDKGGSSPISLVASRGEELLVKLLLENGANVDSQDREGRTPLFRAAERGFGNIVKLLLEKKANVNLQDRDGRTPLLGAAMVGFEDIVKLLLENGAEAYLDDIKTWMTLSQAATKGLESIIKLLLEYGARGHLKDGFRETVLVAAAKIGHEGAAKLLLEHGAKVNGRDSHHTTPLIAAVKGRHEGTKRLLLEHGAKFDSRDSQYKKLLIAAAEMGHEDTVKLFLEHEEKADSRDGHYTTLLIAAARFGHEGTLKVLLDHGAQVDLMDSYCSLTLLIEVARNGYEGIAKVLLEYGAEVDFTDGDYNRTPLIEATRNGHRGTAKVFLEHGARVDLIDSCYDQTPLLEAAENGQERTVKLLLEHGARVNLIVGRSRRTPLLAAAENGHEGIVKLLLEHGARVDLRVGCICLTPLIAAARNGYEGTVKLLLAKGADVNAKDGSGRTPLWHARDWKRKGMIKLLQENGAEVDSNEYDGCVLWTKD